MAVQGLAGKSKARMKSQSGDDLIVSTSERSSQLNAPVSINFNKKKGILSSDMKEGLIFARILISKSNHTFKE